MVKKKKKGFFLNEHTKLHNNMKFILTFLFEKEISFSYREIINVFCFGIGLNSRSELCCRANTRGKRTATAVCL